MWVKNQYLNKAILGKETDQEHFRMEGGNEKAMERLQNAMDHK